MNADTPKQYLYLGGDPIVVRTVRLFNSCPFIDRIYLAVPPSDEAYCRKLFGSKPNVVAPCRVISGGDTRQASVYEGLKAMEKENDPNDLVVIHDGVRPLVTQQQIESCILSAKAHGACILAVPAQDTLKRVESASRIVSGTTARNDIWFAQTPQAFKYEIIRNAHDRALRDGVTGTDDAMLVERLGIQVRVAPGSRMNIKITTPEDLTLAEALLSVST